MAIRQFKSLGLLVSGAALLAQPPLIPTPLTEAERTNLAYTLAHYTKYEYRIPMRGGVRLFAAVYVPKDETQTYPILMQRTPYNVGPYGADNYKPQIGPSLAAGMEGFIFAYEDVRGRYIERRAGLAVVARWEKQHGRFTPKEMNEARRSVRAQLRTSRTVRRSA